MTINNPDDHHLISSDQRGKLIELLLMASDEQEFISIFQEGKEHLLFLSGNLVFENTLVVVKHAVNHDWLNASKILLNWVERIGHGDTRFWQAAIAEAPSINMLDVFFERDTIPHLSQWMGKFAIAQSSDRFFYCFEHVRQHHTYEGGAMTLMLDRLARAGLDTHIELIMEHLNEEDITMALRTACMYDQRGVIDLLYTTERGKMVLDEERATRGKTSLVGTGWAYLQRLELGSILHDEGLHGVASKPRKL